MTAPIPNRIAIVLDSTLASWQRLNVTAFLSSGLAALVPSLVGRPYQDKGGSTYAPMFTVPVIVFQSDGDRLRQLLGAARAHGLSTAVFIPELFATHTDEDNRACVARLMPDELAPVGLGLAGPRPAMNRLLDGLAKHP